MINIPNNKYLQESYILNATRVIFTAKLLMVISPSVFGKSTSPQKSSWDIRMHVQGGLSLCSYHSMQLSLQISAIKAGIFTDGEGLSKISCYSKWINTE